MGHSQVAEILPFLQGTFLKDTAELLASAWCYLEPSWWECPVSRGPEWLPCPFNKAVLHCLKQVVLPCCGLNGASSVLPGGLNILETLTLPCVPVCTQLCGSLGLWALHVDEASFLTLLERGD